MRVIRLRCDNPACHAEATELAAAEQGWLFVRVVAADGAITREHRFDVCRKCTAYRLHEIVAWSHQ